MMKMVYMLGVSILVLISCNYETRLIPEKSVEVKNVVIVLGTIHGGHLKHKEYDISVLSALIRRIDPDFILTEIPPDRFSAVMKEFV